MTPSLASLEKICSAFGVTLSRFFSEGDEAICLTYSQWEILRRWDKLTELQRDALLMLMDSIT